MAGIPIVRTEGKSFGDALTLTPEVMLQRPLLLRSRKTDLTREAERNLELGDALYFFVGHACPAFGDIVLAYEPDWTSQSPGTATPFDTGGLHAGYVNANGAASGVEGRAYLAAHRVPLSEWRAAFDAFLAQFFASPRAYVLGEAPHTDDPTNRLLHPANERRARTWELQVHDDHPLLRSLLLLCVSSDVAEALRIGLLQLSDADAADWDELLDSARFRAAPAAHDAPILCRMAEQEISSWL